MGKQEDIEAAFKKLMTDGAFRKEFAKDPKAAVKAQGWEIPNEMLPEKVDLKVLEQRMSALQLGVQALNQAGIRNQSLLGTAEALRLGTKIGTGNKIIPGAGVGFHMGW